MKTSRKRIPAKAALSEKLRGENHLVLYNDDVNTFDFVIDSLIKVCNHDHYQAEQCALIVHHKGKCSVKDGKVKSLRPMCQALLDLGITASIE